MEKLSTQSFMRSKKILTALILLSSRVVFAQTADDRPDLPKEMQQLRIKATNGEIVDLSSEKRLVILDYWSKACVVCIASFPKIEKLNDRFRNRAVILPVLHGNQQIFDQIKSTSQIVKEANLPFVIGDTILTKQFPHKYVPHYVWLLDKKVIGTSGGSLLTDEIIELVLSNKVKTLSELNKLPQVAALSNDKVASLFKSVKLKNRFYNGIPYQSLIQKMDSSEYFRLGGQRVVGDDTDQALVSIFLGHDPASLIEMIGMGNKFNTIIEQDVPISFAPSASEVNLDNWRSKNAYWYMIRCESWEMSNKQRFNLIKDDLSEAFGIEFRMDTVTRECIVLKCIDSSKLKRYKSKSPAQEEPYYEKTKNGLFIKNCQPYTIVDFMSIYVNQSLKKDLPAVDETWLDKAFDFYIPWPKTNDIVDINNSLKEIGLSLEITERRLKTLVISKKKTKRTR